MDMSHKSLNIEQSPLHPALPPYLLQNPDKSSCESPTF